MFLYLLIGCKSSTTESYENQRWNFSIEYPHNWELNDNSRVANDFSLQADRGRFNRHTVLIDIVAEIPTAEEIDSDLETTMKKYLVFFEGMDHFFKSPFDTVEISPIIENQNHRVIKATVSIPTSEIVTTSNINQMSSSEEDKSQVIDIYILRNSTGQDIVVRVFKGDDDSLNEEADMIVQSIKFISETPAPANADPGQRIDYTDFQ